MRKVARALDNLDTLSFQPVRSRVSYTSLLYACTRGEVFGGRKSRVIENIADFVQN